MSVLIPHWRLTFAAGLFAVSIVLVYFSPDDNDLLETTGDAIESAHRYVNDVVRGDNPRLDEVILTTGDGKHHFEPVPSLSVARDDVGYEEILKLPYVIREPVDAHFAEPKDRLQLMTLESRSDYYVLTFGVRISPYDRGVIKRDGEPMVVAVAIRYFRMKSDSWFKTASRKIANLWFLPEILRRRGSRGSWYLIDFGYTYNLRQFFDWGRENASRLRAQTEKNSDQAVEDWKSFLAREGHWKELTVAAKASVEKCNHWSEVTVNHQLRSATKVLALSEDEC